MTYLLDTHILIWFVEDDPRLTTSVRTLLQDTANVVLVSHASFWEMTIKKSIGKLQITLPQQALERKLSLHLIQSLGFETRHYETLETLPFYHQDPFDRMLIAQAMAEGVGLVTQDQKFTAYESLVRIIWNDV